jgi:GNAT superfamily N-acetyltransferase
MPIYEIESNGQTYEVDAPDEQSAIGALTRGTPRPDPVREKAEADTAAQNAKIAQQQASKGTDWVREGVRQVGRALTLPARGIVGTGAMIEGGLSALGEMAGAPPAIIKPFTQAYEGLRPPELEARGAIEEFVDRGGEGAGGMLLGRSIAEPLVKSAGQVVQRVARTVMDNPGREALAIATGSAAGQAANEAGANPLVETLATVAGGAPAMIGAKPSAMSAADPALARGAAPQSFNPEPYNPRPMGDAAARGRQSGFLLTPDAVTTQRQLEAPMGVRPGDAPGRTVAQLVGPEGPHAIVIENQKNANRLAQRDLGLQEDGRLDPVALEASRMPHNAVFDEVARSLPTLRTDWELGNAAQAIGEARRNNALLRSTASVEDIRDRLLSMEQVPTQDALDAIRSYRQDATRLFRQTEVGGSGVGVLEAEQAAFAYRAAADALESAIERQVGVLYPDLLPRLRESRTALAKSHNVEASLVGAPGNYHVDPGVVAKLGERFPLSGWLKEIADFNNSFPQLSSSRVGVNNPTFQMQSPGAAGNPRHWMNRWFGERLIPRMLSDDFQNEFGRFEPGYDPNPPARPPAASPFADFTPPDPNAPGGGNVMPPAPGGPGLADLIDPAANFDALPPADAQLGDFTADIPPAPQGMPFQASDLVDAPANMGLEPPPARFMGDPLEMPFDNGLDFMLDPDMASASIVRGGGDPGTVQDSLALDQARMGAELRGVPLDPETGAQIAPEGVREPFTRPDPNLGDFVTGFGDEPPDPLLRGPEPPLEGEWIPGGPRPKKPRNPNAGAEDAIGPDQLTGPDDLGAFVDDVPLLPGPQKRLTGPNAGAVNAAKKASQGVSGAEIDVSVASARDAAELGSPFDGDHLMVDFLGRQNEGEKGAGRAALERAVAAADEAGLPMLVSAQDNGSGKLFALYEEAGFEAIPGHPTLMSRSPRGLGDLGMDLPISDEAMDIGRGIVRRIIEGKRNKRAAQEQGLGDDLMLLEDDAPRPTAREFEGDDTPELEPGEFEITGDNRRIILKEADGRLQIQRTNVDPGAQGKGLGQQNLLDAVKAAETRGLPLDGGITMTRDALRPWKSLINKGIVDADGDLAVIERAIEENGGVTKPRPDGKPWLTNIRLGPAG